MATVLNLNVQNSNSPLMEQMIFFYDHSMVIIMMIIALVTYLFFVLFLSYWNNLIFLEGQLIEMIWTLLPSVVLLTIAFPSLRLLYLMDEILNPIMSIKIIGHQWYWTYENYYTNICFDSFMLPEQLESVRLLMVDNSLLLPNNINIRLLITAEDVIHSWAIPSLGVKIDAVPGRMNQSWVCFLRPGQFFGQCSEICGANHSFMPIQVEATSIFI